MRSHQIEQTPMTGDRSPGCTIGGTDREDNRPLAEQLAVRVEQRRLRVVDVRRFRRRAVQLDNGEIPSGFEASTSA